LEAAIVGTGKARAWGVTEFPITYDPPVKGPSESTARQPAAVA
jgi:hypothetical protein